MVKYSTIMRTLMLTILLILSIHVSGLEGSSKAMHARINSRTILRELGYDMPNNEVIEHSYRRSTEVDRKAPGRPDHQHNSGPPGEAH